MERRAIPEAESASEQGAWLLSLRAYFGLILIGNLIWETLQLPLYTIWTAGTLRERAFAVLAATGRLDVKTLGLNTPDYSPEVHYQQVRDAWGGLRTPSGQ